MSTENNYIQQSFSGGLNQQIDPTRISRNEYPLLINGRSRYDVVTNVRLPVQVNDMSLTGVNYQGIYAALNLVFIFIDGKPYYKDMNYPSMSFQPINGAQLDPTVSTVFAALVPTSYANFQRSLVDVDNRNTDVKLGDIIDQTPQALVAQDGKSQPIAILTTNAARQLNRYQEWNLDLREYVPVGRQMLYHDGVLYIISPDGRRIYRSVTGRPLDFMVNIQPGDDGDKWPTENDGSAETVSHAVDYDEITSINRLNTDDGSFFISTRKASYAVTPLIQDTDLVFGEPTFGNRFLFSAGCVSPFSFIELLGDNAFQDFNGLRSFNAILQLKNAGTNSPFSKRIGPILQGIKQDYVASVVFDNYALFACNTIYGRGIIVYDTLSETFVGVDIYPGVDQIKQFAEVKSDDGQRYLFFITADNKLYQAFVGDMATTKLYVGEWCSNDPNMEQNFSQIKLVFVDCKHSGMITVQSFIDRKLEKTMSMILDQKSGNPNDILPIAVPYGAADQDTAQILPFDIGRTTIGWKAGFLITWSIDATLSHVGLLATSQRNVNSVQTQAKMYKNNLAKLNSTGL